MNENLNTAEPVFKFALEGGGATIYRTPLASGGWQFQVKVISMTLTDDFEDEWISWTKEPVQTFQEALRSVGNDRSSGATGLWVCYSPSLVHVDYRQFVWERVQEIISTLPEKRRKLWEEKYRIRWQDHCQCNEAAESGVDDLPCPTYLERHP